MNLSTATNISKMLLQTRQDKDSMCLHVREINNYSFIQKFHVVLSNIGMTQALCEVNGLLAETLLRGCSPSLETGSEGGGGEHSDDGGYCNNCDK